MIILGIDPGYAIVGYGVIEKDERGKCKVLDYGAINTPKEEDFPVRLAMIQDGMKALISKYKPDAVSVEELFFNQNITTGIAVAEARGVILCTAIQCVPRVFEFTPMQIKLAITGNGKAEKRQVQFMTKNILNLKAIPKPDDAADALAVALCLAQTNTKIESSEVEVFTNNNLKKTDKCEIIKRRIKK
jgi:crossover junction endodeoxyribonuclease RuvC